MQRAAERGKILSSIAHELNNYLGVLTGCLELAGRAVDTGDMEKVKRHLGKLQTTCDSVTQFSSELAGRNRSETQKSAINLNTVVDHCVRYAKYQKRFQGIDMQFQLAADLPPVLGDEDEICQLLLNIVNNAADAIKSIKGEGAIVIQTFYDEGHVHLIVEDDGSGISPELRDRLFKENLTTKDDGHGYGLTVSAQILKEHDARYQIDSELGKGSVFTFLFPIYNS
jgi:signal transduction histidine kinase